MFLSLEPAMNHILLGSALIFLPAHSVCSWSALACRDMSPTMASMESTALFDEILGVHEKIWSVQCEIPSKCTLQVCTSWKLSNDNCSKVFLTIGKFLVLHQPGTAKILIKSDFAIQFSIFQLHFRGLKSLMFVHVHSLLLCWFRFKSLRCEARNWNKHLGCALAIQEQPTGLKSHGTFSAPLPVVQTFDT